MTDALGGTTPSEKRLHALCQRSFLKLWTHSNIFRDQGNRAGGDGKEICDEIVVFDNHVLLFSDKECDFPTDGDVSINWQRWYRRAIKKSAEQLFGAERWLRKYPDRVYLDRACTRKLPIWRPNPENVIFHRIAVASGSGQACRKFYGDGTGSLILVPSVKSGDDGSAIANQPFVIGQVDPRGFVHVLDDASLGIVLSEIDTISDFVDYLTWKENFVSDPQFGLSLDERDIVAIFVYRQIGEAWPQDLDYLNYRIMIPEGWWEGLQRDPKFLTYKERIQISYQWDAIIDDFANEVLSGTVVNLSKPGMVSNAGPTVHERRLRTLARPSRVVRTLLAASLRDFIVMASALPDAIRVRVVLPDGLRDSGYVFMRFPYNTSDWHSYEAYRIERQAALQAYVMVYKLRYPHLAHIIGLASEYGDRGDRCSHDIIHIPSEEWTSEAATSAARLQRVLGIGQSSESRRQWRDVVSDSAPPTRKVRKRQSTGKQSKDKRRAQREARRRNRK